MKGDEAIQGVEISNARRIEDAEHDFLSSWFFFFFLIIVFIVYTVQELACSQSYGVNKTQPASAPHGKKPILPRPYGIGPVAHPDLRNPSLPAWSFKTLAAASRPFRQIRKKLQHKSPAGKHKENPSEAPKTKETPKARKEKIDITTRTPGRTG